MLGALVLPDAEAEAEALGVEERGVLLLLLLVARKLLSALAALVEGEIIRARPATVPRLLPLALVLELTALALPLALVLVLAVALRLLEVALAIVIEELP